MTAIDAQLQHQISSQVSLALAEDIGSGDITAQLIPSHETIKAKVITREAAVLCGRAWVEEVFQQLDKDVEIIWHAEEGEQLEADQAIFSLQGNARSILTGERCALNFLQSLSYTATISREYAQLVANTQMTVLDTRKTVPGWRLAQKYAVKIGGAQNHRIGLFDAFLIKENHIMAAGSISQAISQAQSIAPGKTIEIETESLDEVEQAVNAGADIIMLDNFTLEMMETAVKQYGQQVKFEASGNMTKDDLIQVANTGVDYVSVGALTKHIHAIDLSLRVIKD